MAKSRLTRLREMGEEIQRRNAAFSVTPEGRELDLRMEFATRLLRIMKRRGLTKAALCRRIGMKMPQFSRIIQGDVDVRLTSIWRLAQGLGVPPSRLMSNVNAEASAAL